MYVWRPAQTDRDRERESGYQWINAPVCVRARCRFENILKVFSVINGSFFSEEDRVVLRARRKALQVNIMQP